jgi:hypothetical protein
MSRVITVNSYFVGNLLVSLNSYSILLFLSIISFMFAPLSTSFLKSWSKDGSY